MTSIVKNAAPGNAAPGKMILPNALQFWMRPANDIFASLHDMVLDGQDLQRRRVYVDRGSDVLFVAHLDTVLPPMVHKVAHGCIYAQGLDDRLGACLAWRLSKELVADLLLTDNEEICQSTGQHHECKPYNWIVEFDREGTDVVTYEQDNPAFRDALAKYWKIGFGTFSDVCEIKTACCTMNLGIGIYKSHSPDSFCQTNQFVEQVRLFKDFWAQHKDTDFGPRDEQYTNLWTDDLITGRECEMCGGPEGIKLYDEYIICRECFSTLLQYMYQLRSQYD